MGQPKLQAVSYLAPNWFAFYQSVVDYFQRSLKVEIDLQQAPFDPLEDPLLQENRIDFAFICGLPFSRYHKRVPNQLQVLAAPIMQASRYCDRPVYFADVIVKADSSVDTFADLAGKTFCYNDPGSNSGFNLMCWHLGKSGYSTDFFSHWMQSGFHQRSMQWVATGQADCAAIDSTVLEQALVDQPALANQIKVVAAIGPSPMPPIVAATRLGTDRIQQLQVALQNPDPTLQIEMATMGVKRYALLQPQDYEILAAVSESPSRKRFSQVDCNGEKS